MSGFRRIGRNDPCPCGSGRKYKQCCLPREEAFLQARSANGELTELLMRSLRLPDVWPFVEQAWARYWPGEPPQSLEAALAPGDDEESASDLLAFLDWTLHDAVLGEDGATLLDIVTRGAPAGSLDPDELSGRLMASRRASLPSAYQLTRTDPGRGAWFRDIFTDETYEVWDKAATATVAPGDVMILRLRPLAGVHEVTGDGWSFAATEVGPVREWGEHALADLRETNPQAGWRDLWRQRGELLHHYVVERRRHPRVPEMRTTTGEPFVLCSATWRVDDLDALRAALDGAGEDLRRDGAEAEWTWTRRPDDSRFADQVGNLLPGGPALGSLRLDAAGATLTLECLSAARLRAGRDLVETVAGAHVAFLGEERKALDDAMGAEEPEGGGGSTPEPGGVPPEVLRQLSEQFIEKYERQWVDDPIPALGGKTPRQAAASADPALRRRLADLLLEIENAERHMQGSSSTGAGMSAARLRQMLGV